MKKRAMRRFAAILGFALLLALFPACGENTATGHAEEFVPYDESDTAEKTAFHADTLTYEGSERILGFCEYVGEEHDYALLVIRNDGERVLYLLDKSLNQQNWLYTHKENVCDIVWYQNEVYALLEEEDGFGLQIADSGGDPVRHWETDNQPVGMLVYEDDLYFATEKELWWGGYRPVTLPEPEIGYENYIRSICLYEGKPCIFFSAVPITDGGDRPVKNYRMTVVRGNCDEPELLEDVSLFVCTYNGQTLYYLENGDLMRKSADGKPEMLGNLYGFGVGDTSVVTRLFPFANGVLLLRDEALYRLTPGADNRKTVTVAKYYDADYLIANRIASFNSSQNRINVIMRQYEDPEKLNLDILTGKVDMILTTSGYAEKLASLAQNSRLSPIADSFPESIKLGDFLPNLVEACRVKGEVYYLPVLVGVDGLSLPTAVLDGRTNFRDTAEFDETISSLSDQHFYKVITKRQAIEVLFGLDGFEEWVDRENMKAHFIDESFVSLLEIANRFAPDDDTARANFDERREHPLFYKASGLLTAIDIEEMPFAYQKPNENAPYSEYGMEASLFPAPGRGKHHGLSFVSDSFAAVVNPENDAVDDVLKLLFEDKAQAAMAEAVHEGMPSFPVKTSEADDVIRRFVGYTPGENGKKTPLPNKDELQKAMSGYIHGADHLANYGMTPVGEVVEEEAADY
ncbi:MAG: hypothetical protein MJ141_02560, partial [Clostridia bacterium]|nr:hypothetical protein [Clostridia bacterium]